jgi:transcriptional regulator with XRE-family HTH domain
MGEHYKDRIVPERLDELRVRAGIKSDRQLALRLGLAPDQVGRWKKKLTAPSGPTLKRLCDLLDTTAGYLFGNVVNVVAEKAALIEQVERMFGRAEADALRHMQRLSDHHRSILAGRIEGWAESLVHYERVAAEGMPETQFDRDLRFIRERQIAIPDGETARAGGEAGAPASPVASASPRR